MRNYPPIKSWPIAEKYKDMRLQPGEVALVSESKKMYIVAFSGEFRTHRFIPGAEVPGRIVQRDIYPPISEWRAAPKEFKWLRHSLKNGEYTIQESRNGGLYVIALSGDSLKGHLKVPFAEMWEGKYVRKERYPNYVFNWEIFEDHIPLNNREYTISVDSVKWTGMYVLVKYRGRVYTHPYLDYANLAEALEGYTSVPYAEVEKRKK